MSTERCATVEVAQVTVAGPRTATQPRPAAGWRLSGRPAMYLLASLIVSLLAASAAPTPLYAIYQAHWGFTPITTTVVFAVYAVAVLAALLTLGRLSDYVGRRPVLLAALAVQAASLVVFATAGGVPELLAARVIQGLSTGAALGAIGAGMLDIDRERGTLANAAAPGMGTGTGALLSALAVRYLPAPTHLIYLVLLGVIAVQALGVAVMRETVTRSPGAAGALVPEIRLPRTVRAHALTAAPVLFAVWALAGLYAALGPALVRSLIFIVSYLGLGLPAVAAGYRIVHGGGLVGTARDYGAVLILLALFAVGGLLRTRARATREEGA
jgi:MFS family permease